MNIQVVRLLDKCKENRILIKFSNASETVTGGYDVYIYEQDSEEEIINKLENIIKTKGNFKGYEHYYNTISQ